MEKKRILRLGVGASGATELPRRRVHGAGVGPEQDSEALALEWEGRVVLWDQLVGGALATSAAGAALEEDDRDGAGARGGT